MHEDCPEGKNSWCSYQASLVCPEKAHKPIQDPFSADLYKILEPIFKKLGSPKFLAVCENCLTQNPNESLHHVIWGLAPKEQFTSQQETNLAMCLGVMLFNRGIQHTLSQLLPEVGLTVSNKMLEMWSKIDKDRVQGIEYKAEAETRVHRKQMKRLQSRKQDGFRHVEGEQYKSQAFHEDGQERKGKRKQKVDVPMKRG